MTRKLILGFLLLALFFLIGCEKETHTVRYEIDGTVPEMTVHYKNGTNGNESADLAPGWSKEFTVESYYPFANN